MVAAGYQGFSASMQPIMNTQSSESASCEMCTETHALSYPYGTKSSALGNVQHSKATDNDLRVLSIQNETQQTNGLEKVYSHYFAIKDALINGDADQAAHFAQALVDALDAVKLENTDAKAYSHFIKQRVAIKAASADIAGTPKISKQRTQFSVLSDKMYALMQSYKPAYPVYLSYCPMFNNGDGANWISKENTIRNPYYGSRMMTCGKIKETLK